MRIIARKALNDFWTKYADSEQQLKSWYKETKSAKWKNVNELKEEFPNVSIVGNNRFVFNIKGNDYRLIVRINFPIQIVWIRFIGTHSQYDKVNAKEI